MCLGSLHMNIISLKHHKFSKFHILLTMHLLPELLYIQTYKSDVKHCTLC